MKEDKRRLLLEKVLKEHNYQESALLEILHRAQEIYGYLDKDLLSDISRVAESSAKPRVWRSTVLQLL